MSKVVSTPCCVVGSGAASVFFGSLLAHSEVRVIIIEKQADFLRDSCGNTIHPSTMILLDELKLRNEPLRPVDFCTSKPWVSLEGRGFLGLDVSYLDVVCPFVGFVPQWDVRNFLTEKGKEFPEVDPRMLSDTSEMRSKSTTTSQVHTSRCRLADMTTATQLTGMGEVRHDRGVAFRVWVLQGPNRSSTCSGAASSWSGFVTSVGSAIALPSNSSSSRFAVCSRSLGYR